jgi:hypothetical protein
METFYVEHPLLARERKGEILKNNMFSVCALERELFNLFDF